MGLFLTVGKERGDRQVRKLATVTLGMLQFLVKKLREQRPWKVEKIAFSLGFLVLQLPKKILKKVRVKDDVEKIQVFGFSNGLSLSFCFLYYICGKEAG
jgi:hypothetical protein